VPVGSRQIHGAARDTQPDGKVLPASDRIAEADSFASHDVTELSKSAEFDQDNTIGITTDRQPGFEDDVRSGLASGAQFGILVAIGVFRPERDNFIRGEEDDHSLRVGQSGIHHLADVRAGFSGGEEGFVPLDGRQSDGAKKREDGAARATVSAVHHKHPALPLDRWARPAAWLVSLPGRA
jgi:hypothetical protein